MRIAVFGTGGFIGRHLTNELLRNGDDVISYSSSMPHVFDHRTGLLQDFLTLPAGTECVVYLAQSPFYRDVPAQAAHLWSVNVLSALKAAEMARQANATKFIYASTGNVYAPDFCAHREDAPLRRDDWYALSKIHAEEALAAYNDLLSVTSARIFGVFGPGQSGKLIPNLVHAVRTGQVITLGPHPTNETDSNGLHLSLCYIDDAVRILSSMVRHNESGPVNVAGAEVLSVRDIALEIGQRLGISPIFRIADNPRAFDLRADLSKLVNTHNPGFTSFTTGLDLTVGL